MKKLVSFVLASVLCLGMATTVFADPSATTSTVDPSITNEVTSVTSTVPVEVQSVDAVTDYTAAQQTTLAVARTNGSNYVAEIVVNNLSVPVEKIVAATLIDVDATIPAGQTSVDVTFAYPGAVVGDNIVVFHMNDNGVWEVLPVVVGNGTITATFSSFSPVYIVEYTVATASNSTATTPVTSPKTADVNMSLYVTMLALVAMGGVVFATRKAR